jgi:hypothetical protein
MRHGSAKKPKASSIAPVVRSTFDGRPLLPGEVPIVPPDATSDSEGDALKVALAMFDDMLAEPAPNAASPVDGWGMIQAGDSGPQLMEAIEAAVEEALLAEPTEPQISPEVAATIPYEEWGDAGALIEEWFRSGEFLGLEADEGPTNEAGTWLEGLVGRVRRAWGTGRRSPGTPEVA